ncbi:hypothetical protein BKA56DRAFT_698738 [Ilyonectria sp. MPI-CAGE-AT-0026]|nr:hypothetical protein BKA56DRAFT_698738 [Ilyonectria sp. MPI-CAGE-AT-0026]
MQLTYTLLFSLVVGALTAPHATRTAPQNIRTIWSYAKGDSTTSLKVYNSDKTGFGQVNFGNFTYKTRARKDLSGGAIYNKRFNPTSAEVDCILPGIPGFSLQAIAERTVKEKRQIIPCAPIQTTVAVGDGDPHQNYYHLQISGVINCGSAASCSVGYLQSESFTIGFSTSATIYEWLSLGFDVSKSWTTRNTYTCTGEEGDDVCVWYNTAHTAVTVRNYLSKLAPCENPVTVVSDPVIVKSPNSDNRGGGYYCVIGTCRAKGDNYWDKTGPAGGPQ